MPRAFLTRLKLITPALLFLLCGCAVTRIDVDVYKGPMANHADVQTEQLAALAMGAKPLLIELRDEFDKIQVGREGTVKIGDKPSTNLEYRSDFITPPLPSERKPSGEYNSSKQWLVHQQAIEVNAILSLYQDRTDARLADLTGAAQHALERYQNAWNVYTDAWGKDKQIWTSLKVPASKANADLYNAYKAFLIASGQIRKQWLIFAAENGTDLRYATNEQFLELANDQKKLVTNDAAKLYSGHPELNAQQMVFVARVREVSQAFLDARKAMQDLLDVSLQIALRASDESFSISERQKIVDACAQFIVQLIDPTFLYVALCDTTDLATLDLKSKLKLGDGFFNCDDVHSEGFADKKRTLQKQLRNLLVADTASTVYDLIKIDALFQSLKTTKCFDLMPQENRYGLARVRPVSDNNEKFAEDIVQQRKKDMALQAEAPAGTNIGARAADANAPRNVPLLSSSGDELQKLSSGGAFQSGVGLEGGRLDEGLVTSINNYMAATKSFDNSPLSAGAKENLEAKRRALVRQLIHFSEKLIFIADNQFLLTRDNDYGAFKDFKSFNRAAAVLQTIGNSILVAANELYERDDYHTNRDGTPAKDRLETALKEISGLTAGSAFKDEVQQYIADPTTMPEATVSKARADAKKAYDDADQAWKKANADDAEAKTKQSSDEADAGLLTDDKAQIASVDLSKDEDVSSALVELKSDPAKTTPAKLLQALKVKMTSKRDDAKKKDATSKDSKRLSAVVDFVSRVTVPTPDAEGTSSNTAQIVGVALSTAVADVLAADKGVVAAADEQVKQAESKRLEATNALQGERAKTVAALKIILDQLSALQPNQIIHDAVKQALDNMVKTPTDQKDTITEAQAIWAGITVPDALKIIPTPQNATPRDAMDDLLANLRMQHVNAIQQLGANSPRVQQLVAAIHVAEMYRSDMVYIRPPAAYLRTSNVATLLQQGGRDLQWQNLLQQQAFRTTPIMGPALNAETEQNPDYAAIRSIDRQFWQNINSVRVAGSGITNYVITKDDIGNWYVKNYAGDPQPIIDAAKTTALFNAGNAIGGATSANRLLQLEKDPNAEPQSETNLQMSVFTSDYNLATTQFVGDLLGDSTKSKSSAQQSIDTALTSGWANDAGLSDVKDRLTGAKTVAETSTDIAKDAGIAADTDPAKDPKLPDKILNTLKGFKAYQDRLIAGIDNLHLDNSDKIKADHQQVTAKQSDQKTALSKAQSPGALQADQAALATADAALADAQATLSTDLAAAQQQITSAKADVISAFSGILNPLVQKRLDTVNTYSIALNVLQKASAAKPTSAAQKAAAPAVSQQPSSPAS